MFKCYFVNDRLIMTGGISNHSSTDFTVNLDTSSAGSEKIIIAALFDCCGRSGVFV